MILFLSRSRCACEGTDPGTEMFNDGFCRIQRSSPRAMMVLLVTAATANKPRKAATPANIGRSQTGMYELKEHKRQSAKYEPSSIKGPRSPYGSFWEAILNASRSSTDNTASLSADSSSNRHVYIGSNLRSVVGSVASCIQVVYLRLFPYIWTTRAQ
jgi:hypothetical protein